MPQIETKHTVDEPSSNTLPELLSWLRGYAATRLDMNEMNESGVIPASLVLDFGNKGLFGLRMPSSYGGTPLAMGETMRLLEQLAAIDLTISAFVVVHHTSSFPILNSGSVALRERYIPLLASGRMLASFALTEPGAGSNPRAMQTLVTPNGLERWRIDGIKTRVGGAAWAGMLTVFARHNEGVQRGISAFAVPRDTPGIRVGDASDILGVRGALLREIEFSGVAVEQSHLLGELGAGLTVAEQGLAFGRLSVGALSLGAMKRCAQLMLRYASRRQIGTGLLLRNPVTLARMRRVDDAVTAIEMLTSLLAEEIDLGHSVPSEILLALKVAGSEFVWDVADDLVQLLGARGYDEANVAPRILRDARFLRIGEGPTETLLMQLGASLASRSSTTPAFLRHLVKEPEQGLLEVVLSRLTDATDEIEQVLPQVELKEQITLAQWHYFSLGRVGIWSVLEAGLVAARSRRDLSPQRFESALVFVRSGFDHALRQALESFRRSPALWTTQSIVQERVASYEATIGRLDDTIAVPQRKLDPLLREECASGVDGISPSQKVVTEAGATDLESPTEETALDTLLTDLPFDMPFRSDEVPLRTSSRPLEESTAAGLLAIANAAAVEPSRALLAVFSVFLARFSVQEVVELLVFDVDTDTPQTTAVRLDVAGRCSISDLLAQLTDSTTQPRTRWNTPADACRELLTRSEHRNQNVVRRIVTGGLVVCLAVIKDGGKVPTNDELSGVDLCLLVNEGATALELSWIHDAVVLRSETISGRDENLRTLLASASRHPSEDVHTLNLVTAGERQLMLEDWQGKTTPHETWSTTVSALFDLILQSHPDHIAVSVPGEELTYRELAERANVLAHYLKSRGVVRGSIVAISMGRSSHLITSVLATLKTGAAFLTVNCHHPEDRVQWMLEASGAQLVITEVSSHDIMPQVTVEKVRIEPILDAVAERHRADDVLAVNCSPNDTAYVMFTSGSTGRPKGVAVPHASICNQLVWRRDAFGLDASDRVLQSAAPNFDIAVWEYLGALVAGARIVLPGDATQVWDAEEICEQIRVFGVTTIQIVPSQLTTLLAQPNIAQCTSLKRVFSGGEPLPRALQERFYELFEADLINLYGPTEAAIDTTSWRCSRTPQESSAPIGGPLYNKRVYVLDQGCQPVPIGVSGELYIGGGLATGYLGQPSMTEERFVNDPYVDDLDARMYKSGDRVRFRVDGAIDFLGRVDRQVKIRGVRLEPGELEAMLHEHEDVEQIAVVLKERTPGDKHLVAYLVTKKPGEFNASSLREFALSVLPREAVPSAFVSLSSLPVTTTGKVDINALPDVDWARTALAQASHDETAVGSTESSSLEQSLIGIWEAVLQLSVPSAQVDFFEIGGHSLSAVQVLTRVRETYSVELRLRDFFANATVAGLAELINSSTSTVDVVEDPVSTPRTGASPLAGTQESLWYIQQLTPDSGAYNVPEAVRLHGVLDVDALQGALNAISARHESMRTVFRAHDGVPRQHVLPADRVPIQQLDLRDDNLEQAIVEHVEKYSRAAFDLEREPSFRALLLKCAEDDHVFTWVFHHIIADGWSAGNIFVRELSALYCAAREGCDAELPEFCIQPIDYLHWQSKCYPMARLEPQLEYWRQKLEGLSSEPCFPCDHPRPARTTVAGRRVFIELSPEHTERLREFAKIEGTTSFAVLSSAFMVLARIYGGGDDIALGTAVAGRQHPTAEGLIGNFANVIVLRTDLSDDPTLRGLVKRTRNTLLEAVEHSDIPFERVVSALRPNRELGQNPLFDVVITLYNGSLEALTLAGLHSTSITFDPRTSKFDLTVALFEESQSLRGFIEYKTDIFEHQTIVRLGRYFQEVLNVVVTQPEKRCSDVTLDRAEAAQVLSEWNAVETDFPSSSCMHELFEEHARVTPEQVALVCGAQTVNYTELNARANQLAHHLHTLGVGPEVLVGMCVEPSIEMIVGVLGVLKAGGAYVPLDPGLSRDRIQFMIHDTQSPVILTQSHLETRVGDGPFKTLLLDSLDGTVSKLSALNIPCSVSADSLIYVIYTSGSTGKPKGVAVPHRGPVRLVRNTNYTSVDSTDRCAKVCNFAFDASTFEIWLPLANGATLTFVPEHILLSPSEFVEFTKAQDITTMLLPTALFHRIATERPNAFGALSQLIVGGEALDPQRAREVLSSDKPPGRFVNAYGPTEASCIASFFDVAQLEQDAMSVPIGHPISNTTLHVLDKHLNPVPVGIKGELYVGGPGVARGYLGRSELTDACFLADPFSQNGQGRLYKTGDLVRYFSDGNLEFLGRADHQVKIRGFRIEIGEIENCLQDCPSIRQAYVMVRTERGHKMLVAFVVLADGRRSSEAVEVVRRYLKDRLPSYMVPSVILSLEFLPLTTNGKVDRRKLDAIDLVPDDDGCTAGPRNEYELRVAQVWESVIGRPPPNLHTSFFEAGGDSLLAVQFLARLEDEFHRQLPLSQLYEAGTIESLAVELRSEQTTALGSELLHLRQAPGAALFMVHPLSGSAICYGQLSALLSCPFYGLQSAALETDAVPLECIKEMATRYVELLCSVQEEGPYLLGGWSFGGIVALEMASQLEAMRQSVSGLVLFDTAAPGAELASLALDEVLGMALREMSSRFGVELDVQPADMIGQEPSEMMNIAFAEARRLGALPPDAEVTALERLVAVCMANARALNTYKGCRVRANIVLLRASDDAHSDEVFVNGGPRSTDLGWGAFTHGRVTVNMTSGDHMSMLFDPHVKDLSHRLKIYLEGFMQQSSLRQHARNVRSDV